MQKAHLTDLSVLSGTMALLLLLAVFINGNGMGMVSKMMGLNEIFSNSQTASVVEVEPAVASNIDYCINNDQFPGNQRTMPHNCTQDKFDAGSMGMLPTGTCSAPAGTVFNGTSCVAR